MKIEEVGTTTKKKDSKFFQKTETNVSVYGEKYTVVIDNCGSKKRGWFTRLH